jgi:hypothetical protein
MLPTMLEHDRRPFETWDRICGLYGWPQSFATDADANREQRLTRLSDLAPHRRRERQ